MTNCYSYEYLSFLREKILLYLPHNFINIGGKYKGRCPFCGDSKKSASKKRGYWYADNDCSYYCFNCGVSMPGIKLLEALSGQEYDELKREYVRLFLKSNLHCSLSATFVKPDDEPDLFGLKPAVKPEWKKPLTERAKKYLEDRMVTKAPFLREPIYSTAGSDGREYILIPWIANGVEAYYQLNDFLKNGPIKYIFPKDMKKLVYGLDNVDIRWPYVIVFEGVYDSLFVKNAVAVGTKSITDYQLKTIRERYPNHRICVSFDNDVSGLVSMQKMIEKGLDFRFFKWFEDGTKAKDVNEAVLLSGDAGQFSDQAALEKMIMSPLQMKLWMAVNGKWRS